MLKIKKGQFIGIVTLAILILIILATPKYVKRALIYQKAGIDDYTIFENRNIEISTPQPFESDSLALFIKLDSVTESKFDSLQTIAYLIIKDNKILFEKYWDGYDSSSKTNSFSMAKSMIAFLIGAAIDDGFIKSIDEPVANYIPEYRTSENKNLTIKQLLTMSSGLNWDESYGSLFSTTTEAYYGTNINNLILGLKVVESSGKTFNYLSGNTQLLAMIVKAASGKEVSEYAAEKFWKPMGAEYQALWSLDKENGTEKAYCCFNSNARDFARWGILALNNGIWGTDTLLNPAFVKDALAPASYLIDETGAPINYYGYQWWILHSNNLEIPYMRGILGQYVFVIPDQNAVVVRLGHLRSEQKRDHHPTDTYLYVETALKIINQTRTDKLAH